ncbi:hypothetical protein BC829DRAFT_43608 [Chytridium lagenaria]|nr:hypothetical protein BC829DRAFT_43608 [Chytridium lagenaria]
MSKASKNAAPIPVIVPIPNPNGELNDVEWKAFIFTVLPDCKQHENTPTPAVFQQLFDHISSGLRQRFFVISRSELLNWASETSRAYDVSRDVKAFMDSSTADSEFPEVLMAKLVKLRLLVLKHEGIEQRNALKLMKEASDAAVVPSEAPDTQKFVKAGKKEEKEKEKDKIKIKNEESRLHQKRAEKVLIYIFERVCVCVNKLL